jgi:hypothetical protein
MNNGVAVVASDTPQDDSADPSRELAGDVEVARIEQDSATETVGVG